MGHADPDPSPARREDQEPQHQVHRPEHRPHQQRGGDNTPEAAAEAAVETGDFAAGPGAARQVAALEDVLEAAPALRSQVAEAEWVGNRRWNLTFKTGQILALPQGEDEAATALIKFARVDGQNRLLGGKVATFDMRAPPRLYMRIPGRADRLLGEEAEAN